MNHIFACNLISLKRLRDRGIFCDQYVLEELPTYMVRAAFHRCGTFDSVIQALVPSTTSSPKFRGCDSERRAAVGPACPSNSGLLGLCEGQDQAEKF